MNMSLDSRLYKVSEALYKIMQLNFLVLAGSLGIVTAGAALSAAAYVTRKWIENKEVEVFKSFKKSYFENLKKTIVLSILLILAIFLSSLGKNISPLYSFVQIYIVAVFFIVFYLAGNYNMTLKNTVFSGFKALNSHIWIIIPFTGLAYISKWLILKNFMIFFLFGMGLVVLLVNVLIYLIFNKIKKKNRVKKMRILSCKSAFS